MATAQGQTDIFGTTPEVPKADAAPRAPITDAGEKAGGARKDRWKERGLNLDDLAEISASEAAEPVQQSAVQKSE